MPSLSFVFTSLLCFFVVSNASVGNWGGVNSYFLHTLSPADRAAHLSAMQASGLKVLRIFLSGVYKGNKGSSSVGVSELEPRTVGVYDDTVLQQIDTLMTEVVKYDVKLEIMLHDRYSLGCWAEDAYVSKYGIANTAPNCNTQVNQPRVFYVNTSAEADFDRRIAHVLTHQNPYFNNRQWGQISEAVLAFAPENEAQGHMNNPDWNWACRRAQTMRKYISKDIFIATGGGVDFGTSTVSNHFECADIDIVSMHDYSNSASYFTSKLVSARNMSLAHKKLLIMEEFGAQGSDQSKSQFYQDIISTIYNQGIAFMPWEFVKPTSSDYEFYTDDSKTWNVLHSWAARALTQTTPYTWPISNTGGIH